MGIHHHVVMLEPRAFLELAWQALSVTPSHTLAALSTMTYAQLC